MKKKCLLLCLALFVGGFFYNASAQTTRRVNNMPAAAAPYTTIQAAVDAAVAGDIILIEGSPNAYGAVTINKQLTLRGPGYHFTSGNPANPIIPANTSSAVISGAITLNPGSSGTIIEGLVNVSIVTGGSPSSTVAINNITVRRCYSVILNTNPSVTHSFNNWLITQCDGVWEIYGNALHNCTFMVSNCTNVGGHTGSNSTGVYLNNVIVGVFDVGANNLTFQNNIFIAPNHTIQVAAGYSVSIGHCLFAGTWSIQTAGGAVIPISGSGNQTGVDMETGDVFVGYPNQGTYSNDSRWKLKANSPAIGAGAGQVDCGAFGGATPYVLSGIPAGPVITYMNTSGGGSNTIPLNVTINATTGQ